MDTPEQDGSGRAEEESWNPGGPAVQEDEWKPAALAFGAYRPPLLGRQPDQNGTVHPLRVVVDRPIVVKLTKDILETYQSCNPDVTYLPAPNPKRYLTNPSVPALNSGLDNENSDLILAVNEVLVNEQLNHRYIVNDLLGQGTFGQVAKCWANERESFVAVKIIKNQTAYYQQALVEVTILNLLNGKFDPEDKHHIVRILEHFVYHKHLCIVFEMLSVNLFELLKLNQFKGITLNLIRIFSKQILTALSVLREASLIHCDLKPENILLTTRPASAEIKLIDYGSACWECRTVYSYIQSRFYRSPEVVLGHEYTTAIDMWSFGCVAAELFLGLPLFPGQSQYDLLQRMIQILGGQPPDHILRNAKNTSKYFKHVGAPTRHSDYTGEVQHSAYQFLSLPEYEAREREHPAIGKHYLSGNLEQRITNYHMKTRMSPEEMEKERIRRFVFVDFLKGLLHFDPLRRWTPRQAAQHPFVTEEPFMGSFQPLPETPRTPIRHGMTVDHNPVLGHWCGAGLSPQVNTNAVLQYGSPQYPGPPFSYASSYGSAGSYGSFGDGGYGMGNSFGSYGDAVGSYNHQTPSTVGNPNFGVSPDTRRRMNLVPHSSLGHAPLGLSPSSGSLMPLSSLGASPSNFTPPSSHFQPSPGSPSTGSSSRYGPTSPARSGGGAAALSKAAAFGQYRKGRGWGSPGSAANTTSGSHSSVLENSVVPWLSHQTTYTGNDETSPSFYVDNTVQNSLSGSPGNPSLQGSLHAMQIRQKNEIAPGMISGQVQNSKKKSYPSGTLGALISKAQPTVDGGEDISPPPNPSDWDPNYSEDLLLQNDGGETVSSGVSAVTSLSGATGVGGTQGPTPLSMGLIPLDSSGIASHDMYLQGGSQTAGFRPSGVMPHYMEGSPQSLQGYGWNSPKHLHFGPHPQQISPSRLGQQTPQFLQQQLLHQHHPSNLHSSDHAPHSISVAQQRFRNQFRAQTMQLPGQPFPFQTSGNNVILNGETGGHAVLPSPKRDGRTDHSQMLPPAGGNFGRHIGLDLYHYDHLPGLHTQDHSNFISEGGSHWVARFPNQTPRTNPNEWYNGRSFGNLNRSLLPPPRRRDRRDM